MSKVWRCYFGNNQRLSNWIIKNSLDDNLSNKNPINPKEALKLQRILLDKVIISNCIK